MKDNRRVALVTGANGFIGSHLCRRLDSSGFEVVKIGHELLSSPDYLKGYCEQVSPDFIFHCAAYGNMSIHTDETRIIEANITRTWNLLNATKNVNYDLMINVSTSSVYGRSFQPMKETQKLHPDTLYAATKAAGEHLCRAFRKNNKKMIVTVRPFSVYGPGEASYRFIPTVIAKAKSHESVQLMEGTHDWIYIDDLIDGMMTLVKRKDDLKHRTYNLGTGVSYSNEMVIEKLSAHLKIPYVKTGKRKPQDSLLWQADIGRMEALGWTPAHTLDQGLEKVYVYYK